MTGIVVVAFSCVILRKIVVITIRNKKAFINKLCLFRFSNLSGNIPKPWEIQLK